MKNHPLFKFLKVVFFILISPFLFFYLGYLTSWEDFDINLIN
jgi:hypothetical protein